MSSVPDLHTDVLFVGLTRPATLWGIPLVAFVIEFMTTVLIFLAVMWMKTVGRCRNTRFWGSASFSPTATAKWTA